METFVKIRTAPLWILLALLVSCTYRSAIVLTETDDRRTVAIDAGETLEIRLASNPTTGYRWALANPVEHLEMVGGNASFEPSASALAGAGGHEIFLFRAKTVGREVIDLRYARPWETDAAPARVYQLTVEVR
jgi:inhibitor of cysteine peptidase